MVREHLILVLWEWYLQLQYGKFGCEDGDLFVENYYQSEGSYQDYCQVGEGDVQ